METIEFECPYCSRVSKVPMSFAGRQGKCPGCLKLLEVPDPNAPEPAEPKPEEVAFELTEDQPADSDAPTAVRVEAPPTPEVSGAAPTAPAVEVVGSPVDAEEPTKISLSVQEKSEDQVAAESKAKLQDKARSLAAAFGPGAGKPTLGLGATEAEPVDEAPEADPERRRLPERPCPYCGEQIRKIAKKCRFCGEFLDKELARSRRRGGSRLPLASPGARLGAWAIDFIMFWAPSVAPFAAGMYVLEKTSGAKGDIVGGILICLGIACALFVLIYNWVLIATRGQTIGKRLLKLKIVLETGKPVNFVQGVLLRNFITGTLSGPWLSWLGCLFFIIDACMIFSQERRCLHDHIASTRVIELTERKSRLRSVKRLRPQRGNLPPV